MYYIMLKEVNHYKTLISSFIGIYKIDKINTSFYTCIDLYLYYHNVKQYNEPWINYVLVPLNNLNKFIKTEVISNPDHELYYKNLHDYIKNNYSEYFLLMGIENI